MIWIYFGAGVIVGGLLATIYAATRFAPIMTENRRQWEENFAEVTADIVRAKDEEIKRLEQIIRDNV